MSDEVLVAFATSEEPTHAIASAVADILREEGISVTVESLEAVGGIRRFRAVILGTAIHDRTWFPGIGEFILAHQRDLEVVPTWIFASGPVEREHEGPPFGEPPGALIRLLDGIDLRDVALFAGTLQPHHLAAGLRVLSRITKTTVDDHRDWEAVRRWARTIRAVVRGAPASPAAVGSILGDRTS
jgi:menaquinone-dependent protoporphyrinogen oxidase